ncbi:hypothetical protein LIER_18359 [Lithospermum erythrorhizon]|uniref:CCHC-type domain-containing protein n=1 Tax=Lithospermum erythrorhizon TaxID=34254 RepID=A0AAV3QDX1_LITER
MAALERDLILMTQGGLFVDEYERRFSVLVTECRIVAREREREREMICFNCQQPGHLSRDCPQSLRVGGSSTTSPAQSARGGYHGARVGRFGGRGGQGHGVGGSLSGEHSRYQPEWGGVRLMLLPSRRCKILSEL